MFISQINWVFNGNYWASYSVQYEGERVNSDLPKQTIGAPDRISGWCETGKEDIGLVYIMQEYKNNLLLEKDKINSVLLTLI